MAWAALVAGLGFPLLILGTESRELGDLAYPFYIFVGSVVGAYIGFATVDDKWHQTNPNRRSRGRPDRLGGRLESQRNDHAESDRWHGGKAF